MGEWELLQSEAAGTAMAAAAEFHGDLGQVVVFLAWRVVEGDFPCLARPFESEAGVMLRFESSGEQVGVVAGVVAGEEVESLEVEGKTVAGDDVLVLLGLGVLDGFAAGEQILDFTHTVSQQSIPARAKVAGAKAVLEKVGAGVAFVQDVVFPGEADGERFGDGSVDVFLLFWEPGLLGKFSEELPRQAARGHSVNAVSGRAGGPLLDGALVVVNPDQVRLAPRRHRVEAFR